MYNEKRLTFPALFDEAVTKYGKENFLSYVDEEPLTYKEVGDEIEKLKLILVKN